MLQDVLKDLKGFEWDDANIEHIAKHDVAPEEAEQAFFDSKNLIGEDINHSLVEQRFLIIGKTKKSRLLYQVFTIRKKKIRIVSSRDINKKEVKLYEEKTYRSKVQK